jgi:hypothetical protein
MLADWLLSVFVAKQAGAGRIFELPFSTERLDYAL